MSIQNDIPHPKRADKWRKLFESDSEIVTLAIHQLIGGNKAECAAGLRVAWLNRLELKEDLIDKILESGPAVSAAAAYCGAMNLRNFIPKLNQMLIEGRSGVFETVLGIGDPSSRAALESVYDRLIAGYPIRRSKYTTLQAMWAVSELSQAVNPLPEKTTGVYLREGGKGTAFPVSNVEVPTCDCCKEPMVCLFRLPKVADPLEMPVFHCPRCDFDGDIYLDLSLSPPQWIGRCGGTKGERTPVNGGVIAWGLDIQGAEDSRTFLGGEPDWVQGEVGVEKEFQCPKCEQKMEFVIQMESDYAMGTGLNFFHGGIMYIHRCRECHVACYFFQTS